MIYRISHPTGKLIGEVQLPRSKSISNRLLMLQAQTPSDFVIEGLAEATDTLDLQRCLQSTDEQVYAGQGGTTYRFLLAYLAARPGVRLLDCDKQMQARPIGPLVEALRQLGADIRFLGKEGFPPVRIQGKALPGGKLLLSADLSSQFVSALLLAAPGFSQGLHIELTGQPVSASYIDLSVGLMRRCGIDLKRESQTIQVKPGLPKGGTYTVEADWSAASYYLTMALLADTSALFLPGLQAESLQGDAVIPDLLRPFGLDTAFDKAGLHIRKNPAVQPKLPEALQLRATPDLVPTLAVFSALVKEPIVLQGIDHLRHKESDRLSALQAELPKLGAQFLESGDGWRVQPQSGLSSPGTPRVRTYGDHRMAMAFATCALRESGVEIEDPAVVDKSHPTFWEQLRSLGFHVEEV